MPDKPNKQGIIRHILRGIKMASDGYNRWEERLNRAVQAGKNDYYAHAKRLVDEQVERTRRNSEEDAENLPPPDMPDAAAADRYRQLVKNAMWDMPAPPMRMTVGGPDWIVAHTPYFVDGGRYAESHSYTASYTASNTTSDFYQRYHFGSDWAIKKDAHIYRSAAEIVLIEGVNKGMPENIELQVSSADAGKAHTDAPPAPAVIAYAGDLGDEPESHDPNAAETLAKIINLVQEHGNYTHGNGDLIAQYTQAVIDYKAHAKSFGDALRQSLIEAWHCGKGLSTIASILDVVGVSFRTFVLAQDALGYATAYRVLGLARAITLQDIENSPSMTLTAAYLLAANGTPPSVRHAVLRGENAGEKPDKITETYVSEIRRLFELGPSWLWGDWMAGRVSHDTGMRYLDATIDAPSIVQEIAATHHITSPEVIGLLSKMADEKIQGRDDLLDELRATGHLQGGGDPIPLFEATVRDFANYFDEARRAHVAGLLAEKAALTIGVPVEIIRVAPQSSNAEDGPIIVTLRVADKKRLSEILNDRRPVKGVALDVTFEPVNRVKVIKPAKARAK